MRALVATLAIPALCAAIGATSACDGGATEDGQAPATFVVGPTGGRFTANGVVMAIPPGAVSTDVAITVAERASAPAGYAVDGKVYDFAPAGTSFAVPVTVTFPARDAAHVVQWSLPESEAAFAPLFTTFGTDGASAQVTHFSSGFVGASTTGVTCVTETPQPDCSVQTSTETPRFWFTTYPGAPSGDARAAIGTDSSGLAKLLGTPLFYNAGPHTTYLSKGCCSGDFGTAHVGDDVMTSFTANASRDVPILGCLNGPQLKVQCSGGNVPLSTASAPDPVAVDGGSDASATDASAPDAGDASDAGACISPAAIDPYSSLDVPATSFPLGSFGCNPDAYLGGMKVTARVFTVTKSVKFVQYQNHTTMGSPASTSQLRAGCDALSAPLATSRYDGHTTLTTLAPGTYTFIACDGYTGAFVAEPEPVAVNTNTSCATASTTLTAQHRVYDSSTKLYFKFTPYPSATTVYFWNVNPPRMATGSYRIEVRTTCDDPATDVADRIGSALRPNGDATTPATDGVLAPSYWIVLSELDPGMQPAMSFSLFAP